MMVRAATRDVTPRTRLGRRQAHLRPFHVAIVGALKGVEYRRTETTAVIDQRLRSDSCELEYGEAV